MSLSPAIVTTTTTSADTPWQEFRLDWAPMVPQVVWLFCHSKGCRASFFYDRAAGEVRCSEHGWSPAYRQWLRATRSLRAA